MRTLSLISASLILAFAVPASVQAQERQASDPAPASDLQLPRLWQYTRPLISPEPRDQDPSHAQKDPTIVRHNGRWHLFMTVKLPTRSAIEYASFTDWDQANEAPRTLLPLSQSNYFCAPQVFYFEPHQKWYLIYQVGKPGTRFLQVAYSTTTDIADPASWTPATPMLDAGPGDPRTVGGIDFWIICDDHRAYLFYTSNNGKMWRLWTDLDQFPHGFDHPALALEGPFFEASHTYRLKGLEKYLTVIEEDHRRYYKAYLADRLDGPWTPLAVTADHPFAAWTNIQPAPGVDPWTDNISHGELLRDSNDQTLTIDPANLRFLFQGLLDTEKTGLPYGQFPWRLGLLTPAETPIEESGKK